MSVTEARVMSTPDLRLGFKRILHCRLSNLDFLHANCYDKHYEKMFLSSIQINLNSNDVCMSVCIVTSRVGQ